MGTNGNGAATPTTSRPRSPSSRDDAKHLNVGEPPPCERSRGDERSRADKGKCMEKVSRSSTKAKKKPVLGLLLARSILIFLF